MVDDEVFVNSFGRKHPAGPQLQLIAQNGNQLVQPSRCGMLGVKCPQLYVYHYDKAIGTEHDVRTYGTPQS